jgi:D-glycero-alpha-D-manno-heptose 1-phosphate guanylyltransferase
MAEYAAHASSGKRRHDAYVLRAGSRLLCGGLPTRCPGVLPDVPKALAPVAGRPFLDDVLLNLVAPDIREFVLRIGYHREKIEAA